MRRSLGSGLIVLLVLMTIACAGFEKNTYRTLSATGGAYTMAMSTVSTLQKQGVISTTQRTEINTFAEIFYVAYHASVDAFEVWKKASSVANKNKVEVAISSTLSKWRNFADYINRIRPNTVPLNPEEVE
jgi:hypothetical protein